MLDNFKNWVDLHQAMSLSKKPFTKIEMALKKPHSNYFLNCLLSEIVFQFCEKIKNISHSEFKIRPIEELKEKNHLKEYQHVAKNIMKQIDLIEKFNNQTINRDFHQQYNNLLHNAYKGFHVVFYLIGNDHYIKNHKVILKKEMFEILTSNMRFSEFRQLVRKHDISSEIYADRLLLLETKGLKEKANQDLKKKTVSLL